MSKEAVFWWGGETECLFGPHSVYLWELKFLLVGAEIEVADIKINIWVTHFDRQKGER